MIGLVAIFVRDIGTVAGIMQHEYVALPGTLYQLDDAGLNGLLCGGEVGQPDDIFILKTVILHQHTTHILHIIDTAAQVDAGNFVVVNSN